MSRYTQHNPPAMEKGLQMIECNPRVQPLEIDIIKGRLVISVGVETIGHAISLSPYIMRFEDGEEPQITDPDLFAKEIVRELDRESEDGTTLIHLALDKAAERAIENGCEGVAYDE